MRGAEGLKSEKGVQHMRQDAHEQPKMQGRKGPPRKEEGGTTIGSTTNGGTTPRILILKSELKYSIRELCLEESRSEDSKHRTLAVR
jgi:hypothetical protein